MRKFSAGHKGQAKERVLELSADAHITRRNGPKDSLAFHSLTSYGIAECGFSERVAAVSRRAKRHEGVRITGVLLPGNCLPFRIFSYCHGIKRLTGRSG